MKKAILNRTAYIVELDDNDDAEALTDNLDRNTPEAIRIDDNHVAGWVYSSPLVLDPFTMNCGQCYHCGAWASDWEQDNVIRELSKGAKRDGKLYCDICLPGDLVSPAYYLGIGVLLSALVLPMIKNHTKQI